MAAEIIRPTRKTRGRQTTKTLSLLRMDFGVALKRVLLASDNDFNL
jgi:hypothetical protein